MTFQFIEVPEYIETTGKPPSVTTHYKATGSSSSSYVNAYALSATPAVVSTIYGTLYRQDLRVKQVAFDHFTVQVPYGPRKNVTGEWSFDFDTTGGTIHITNAKEERNRYPATTAPDQKGAIGVDGDAVTGTDIVIPALKMNVAFKHPLGQVTIALAKYLAKITGTVNNDSFLTFSPGEVLFLGARGADGTTAEATVNYQFAMSANADSLSIGDVANIVKRGHDVAWIKYKDDIETADSVDHAVRVPEYVYVDRVYDEIAMATALGFGG